MFTTNSDKPQQWSLHAEVTISHENSEGNHPGVAQTEQSDRGVHMVYSWNSQKNAPTVSSNSSSSTQNQSLRSNPSSYGFQRGNIFFTTTPPDRNLPTNYSNVELNRLTIPSDSGYNSEQLLSPSTTNNLNHNFTKRFLSSNDKQCKSTCNIIVSTDVRSNGCNISHTIRTEPKNITANCHRTQSLRCQTPSHRIEKRSDGYYGCGDPWCHHSYTESSRISPVPESCEDCSIDDDNTSSNQCPTRFRPHFCIKLPEPKKTVRDAASQTFETKEKCTSPMHKFPLHISPFNEGGHKTPESTSKKKKKYESRNKTEPISKMYGSNYSDHSKLRNNQTTRSPVKLRRRSPLQKSPKSSDILNETDRKPRTVHIDVYCTGSDADSDSTSSDNSERNKSTSTPQTVYETDKLRVTHKRVQNNDLPMSFLNNLNFSGSSNSSSQNSQITALNQLTKNNSLISEPDTISSLYPSQFSSRSTIPGFESSLSSIPASWISMSTSSCTLPGFDSIQGTSWKDTTSDMESLMQSGLSIPQVAGRDFIPQLSNSTINISTDLSMASVAPSDSFDYADSADKLRIKMMEEMWKQNDNQKPWKSPSVERKHLLQRQKMQEYLQKRIKDKSLPKWKNESESEDASEDESEQGWSFVRDNNSNLGSSVKRDETIRRSEKNIKQLEKTKFEEMKQNIPTQAGNPKPLLTKTVFKMSPADNVSELLMRAKLFGETVVPLKRLGHHTGPAKNADCTCEHCILYSEKRRNRTRSFGDTPIGKVNWKEQLNRQQRIALEQKNPNYTDY